MASQGYRDWLNAGQPYTLIRPAKAVQATLRGYGLTVFDYPNEEHQKANTPEDHTPYSVTGWPAANKRWNARGLDVMPRSDSNAHRKENADIARQIIRDKDAGHKGVAWIKYINWTDENGNCYHVSYQPNKSVSRSNDDGHIHISGRSDYDNNTDADSYDPIKRMYGIEGGIEMELGTKVPEPLYADFNGDNPDDAAIGLTVGQMLAQTHQNAWYARSAAGDALRLVKELQVPSAPEAIDYDKLAHALLRVIAEGNQS